MMHTFNAAFASVTIVIILHFVQTTAHGGQNAAFLALMQGNEFKSSLLLGWEAHVLKTIGQLLVSDDRPDGKPLLVIAPHLLPLSDQAGSRLAHCRTGYPKNASSQCSNRQEATAAASGQIVCVGEGCKSLLFMQRINMSTTADGAIRQTCSVSSLGVPANEIWMQSRAKCSNLVVKDKLCLSSCAISSHGGSDGFCFKCSTNNVQKMYSDLSLACSVSDFSKSQPSSHSNCREERGHAGFGALFSMQPMDLTASQFSILLASVERDSPIVHELALDVQTGIPTANAKMAMNAIFKRNAQNRHCHGFSTHIVVTGHASSRNVPLLPKVYVMYGIDSRVLEDMAAAPFPSVSQKTLSALEAEQEPWFIIGPVKVLPDNWEAAAKSLCREANIAVFGVYVNIVSPPKHQLEKLAFHSVENSYVRVKEMCLRSAEQVIGESLACQVHGKKSKPAMFFCKQNPLIHGHGAQFHSLLHAFKVATVKRRSLALNNSSPWAFDDGLKCPVFGCWLRQLPCHSAHPHTPLESDVPSASSEEKCPSSQASEQGSDCAIGCDSSSNSLGNSQFRWMRTWTFIPSASNHEQECSQQSLPLQVANGLALKMLLKPSERLFALVQQEMRHLDIHSRRFIAMHIRRGHKYVEKIDAPEESLLQGCLEIARQTGAKVVLIISEDAHAVAEWNHTLSLHGLSAVWTRNNRHQLRISIPMAIHLGILDADSENKTSLLNLFMSANALGVVGSMTSGYSRLLLEMACGHQRTAVPYYSTDTVYFA